MFTTGMMELDQGRRHQRHEEDPAPRQARLLLRLGLERTLRILGRQSIGDDAARILRQRSGRRWVKTTIMVSINSTLEVDLTGQCASESIGPLPVFRHRRTGGHRRRRAKREERTLVSSPSIRRRW
ncbi:MAG: hypothetical protein MZU97_24300 [Bacillus subtilis]|nr:hypothetical protein [Bacillus subtilis]